MSHVEFKKKTCRPVEFKGQGPFYTKKHRGGCTRSLLRPGPSITNRARSVRLVIGG